MKRILFVFIILTMATSAQSAELTCTLPAAYVPRGLELCEELRVRMNVRSLDWNDNTCASAFLRIGLLAGDKESTRLAARAAVRQAVNDAVDSFNTDFPRVAVIAECGDTILDAEFGETCDDGNRIAGDGCDESCVIEP